MLYITIIAKYPVHLIVLYLFFNKILKKKLILIVQLYLIHKCSQLDIIHQKNIKFMLGGTNLNGYFYRQSPMLTTIPKPWTPEIPWWYIPKPKPWPLADPYAHPYSIPTQHFQSYQQYHQYQPYR